MANLDSHRIPTAQSVSTTTPVAVSTRLSIKQINLHKAIGATTLIGNTIESMQTRKQPLLYLIQEPWTDGFRIKGIDQNKVKLFYHKSDKNPRAGILATGELDITFMPQLSNPDTVTISLRTANDEEVLVTSFYLAHDSTEEIPGSMFQEIFNYSQETNIPVIMGGDANAHHIIWGSTKTNRRGEVLLEYLSSTNLEILNKGNSPTFVTKTRSEVLDITLASRNIASQVSHTI